MHIIVCLKQVLDPEITPRYFKLNDETNRPEAGDADMVMDSYAENALELAIQLRDKTPDASVTALCLGDEDSEDVLRRALAFTADTAVRVWDEGWEELDGQAVGYILAETIKSIGGADIVLTGYQASDIEEGLVGTVIAEELGISCITVVSDLEIQADSVNATCESEDGTVVVNVKKPAVFTIISSEKNVPRLPKVKDIRLSKSKPITELTAEDLNIIHEHSQPAVTLSQVYIPSRDVACEMITGKGEEDFAVDLAGRLIELKVF